jgi:glyoxylase-like metal-dependent hydrolase (beta-lactamase superfamily II)
MGLPKPTELADGVVRLGTPIVNWYLVADDSGVTMVDSGVQGFMPQLEPGLELLGRSVEDLRAIVLTHGDADHVGVATRMQKAGNQTPIHLNPADRYLAEKHQKKTEDSMVRQMLKPGAVKLFAHFARYGALNQPKIGPSVGLSGDQTLEVPGRPRVIAAPGHTEGHVVFHFPEHGALFVGDSICTWHPVDGRRGPQLMAFNVSNAQALESLSRWEGLDAGLLLVGHGEPWTQGPAAAVAAARSAAAA